MNDLKGGDQGGRIAALESRIHMAIDLVPQIIVPTTPLMQGQTLYPMTLAILNNGKSDLPIRTQFDFTVFISSARSLTGRVASFHGYYEDGVFAGEPVKLSADVFENWTGIGPPAVPRSLSAGSYYIGFQLDDGDNERFRIPESNESNNRTWSTKPITVTKAPGVLTIRGTEKADSISITREGWDIVLVNGKQKTRFQDWPFAKTEILGLGGNDRIFSTPNFTDRAVYLSGGDGDDRIVGNGTLSGAAGRDTIISNGAADLLFGGDGSDRLTGDEDDTLDGGNGNDVLSGAISILGGNGNDILTGAKTSSRLSGGAGNDTFFSSAGAARDTVVGGPGDDTATVNGHLFQYYDIVSEVEHILEK